ncbi:Dabb family protein [Aquimarina mytili]|uniref:Dabb family protein n=1 Tax=Aquimarina mytili TaxID=874423 RepID=A0A936ZRS5_9FLAO|nr:Dabb family protein [Aquimarina mytili]MBL0683122.1 Dabb family protein [Aquimarina mytili]
MKFIISTLLFFIGFASIAQTTANKEVLNSRTIKGDFVHTVLFWLNNPDNLMDRKTFEDGVSTLFKECQFITSSHIGIPADTATRPIVDDSYTYCVVLTFKSKEAHDNYQVDPIHKKFVEENKNLWNKIVVYDSVSF